MAGQPLVAGPGSEAAPAGYVPESSHLHPSFFCRSIAPHAPSPRSKSLCTIFLSSPLSQSDGLLSLTQICLILFSETLHKIPISKSRVEFIFVEEFQSFKNRKTDMFLSFLCTKVRVDLYCTLIQLIRLTKPLKVMQDLHCGGAKHHVFPMWLELRFRSTCARDTKRDGNSSEVAAPYIEPVHRYTSQVNLRICSHGRAI